MVVDTKGCYADYNEGKCRRNQEGTCKIKRVRQEMNIYKIYNNYPIIIIV